MSTSAPGLARTVLDGIPTLVYPIYTDSPTESWQFSTGNTNKCAKFAILNCQYLYLTKFYSLMLTGFTVMGNTMPWTQLTFIWTLFWL